MQRGLIPWDTCGKVSASVMVSRISFSSSAQNLIDYEIHVTAETISEHSAILARNIPRSCDSGKERKQTEGKTCCNCLARALV